MRLVKVEPIMDRLLEWGGTHDKEVLMSCVITANMCVTPVVNPLCVLHTLEYVVAVLCLIASLTNTRVRTNAVSQHR